jgi:hypothetical protein
MNDSSLLPERTEANREPKQSTAVQSPSMSQSRSMRFSDISGDRRGRDGLAPPDRTLPHTEMKRKSVTLVD